VKPATASSSSDAAGSPALTVDHDPLLQCRILLVVDEDQLARVAAELHHLSESDRTPLEGQGVVGSVGGKPVRSKFNRRASVIRSASGEGAAGEEGVPCKVELVEPTGLGTILHVRPFDATLKAFTLSRDVSGSDAVTIRLPAERLHLFDAQSGQRLS